MAFDDLGGMRAAATAPHSRHEADMGEAPDAPEAADPAADACPAMAALPTLQRNAMRKLLQRPAFTPEDVARVGHQRLRQAEGVGQKGLGIILAWLREHGCEPHAPGNEGIHDARKAARERSRLEAALRIVRTHGYVAYRRRDAREGGEAAASSCPRAAAE